MDSVPWEQARSNPSITGWLTSIVTRADKEATEPLPELTDELYSSFFRTEQRLPFENMYFERRKRLGRAAMAVLLGDASTRARLVPSLVAKIGEIMAEESWTLPAHVWTEPSGKNPMTIDLFAAETANLMAELLTLFGSVVPDALAGRIRERLRVQFFDNYVQRHAEMHWTKLPMNWNAVCHQGVLGAALALDDDVERLAQMLALVGRYLRIYLEGFGADGSTSEGPGYWSYGFGWFSELNAQLETRTAGRLSLFEGDPLIPRIAAFAPALALSNGYLVNFSDNSCRALLNPSLLTYLGERLKLPSVLAQGRDNYRQLAKDGLNLDGQRVDLFYLARLFLRCPDLRTASEAAQTPDAYFADYGAMVARGRDGLGNLWEFAAKGGHNAEHHNHNDCGSYLLNFNGERALLEIGAPEYDRGFFSTRRYTYLAARSLGHSVPLVNGHEQPAGAEYAATVLAYDNQPAQVKFVVDLTACYPAEAGCRRLVRSFVFDRGNGGLTVEDRFELNDTGQIETILVFDSPFRRAGAGGIIDTPGGPLRLTPGDGSICGEVEACPYRMHRGADAEVNRLRLRLPAPVAAGTLSYRLDVAAGAVV